MAYISKYSGADIDNAVGINEIQNNDIATLKSQVASLTNLINTYWQTIYPVGSIYMSLNSTSPATLFGGTWTQLKDRFLIGAGSISANSIGGATNHTHDYGLQAGGYYRDISMENNENAGVYTYDINNNRSLGSCTSVGSFTAPINGNSTSNNTSVSMNHFSMTGNTSYTSNLPPYLSVYMWQRTA